MPDPPPSHARETAPTNNDSSSGSEAAIARAKELIAKGEAPVKPEFCTYSAGAAAGEKRKRAPPGGGDIHAKAKKQTPSEQRREYRKIMQGPQRTSSSSGSGSSGSRAVSTEVNHLGADMMRRLRKHQIDFPATVKAMKKFGIEAKTKKYSSKWDPKNFDGKRRQDKWSSMIQEVAKEAHEAADVQALLEKLAVRDNVPKKRNRFGNFCKYVEKVKDEEVIETVWELLQKRRTESREVDLKQLHQAQAQLLCWGFQQGTCTFGEKCRFSHDPNQASGSSNSSGSGGGGEGGEGKASSSADAGAPHNYFAQQLGRKCQGQIFRIISSRTFGFICPLPAEAAAAGSAPADSSSSTEKLFFHVADAEEGVRRALGRGPKPGAKDGAGQAAKVKAEGGGKGGDSTGEGATAASVLLQAGDLVEYEVIKDELKKGKYKAVNIRLLQRSQQTIPAGKSLTDADAKEGAADGAAAAATATATATAAAAAEAQTSTPMEVSAAAGSAAAASEPEAKPAQAHGKEEKEGGKKEENGGGEYVETKRHPRERKLIDFSNKTYLAPLTTVGNLPFRRVCKDLGVDITVGEMAMANNLLSGHQGEWALLRRHSSEDIFGVQIAGGYPEQMGQCCEMLNDFCEVDFVDLNLGCPIDVVCNKGAGSALMQRQSRMRRIIQTCSEVLTNCPLTIKMRKGYADNKPVAHELMPKLRGWGVSAVTVHGRSRQQRYSKLADWQYIQRCAEASSVPFIGNGDVFAYTDHQAHVSSLAGDADMTGGGKMDIVQTWDGADGDGGGGGGGGDSEGSGGGGRIATTMVARGALIKPWIFTEIKEQRHWDISANERLGLLQNFVSYGLEHWGSDDRGVASTRRFILEWLSFLYRYIPVGLLERVPDHPPQRLHWRPPRFEGRSDLETLMGSGEVQDWLQLCELAGLPPTPPELGSKFEAKHKSYAWKRSDADGAGAGGAANGGGGDEGGSNDVQG